MRILITGYSRSGTTLVRKLIAAHTECRGILHETMILVANRGVIANSRILYGWQGGDPILMKAMCDVNEDTWGEKILYDYPCIDGGVVDALDYCLFWNELFLPKAVIVNVIRYPLDVVLSSKKKKGVSLDGALRTYKKWMPDMSFKIDALPNAFTIRFEDLLEQPMAVLERVFDKCRMDSARGAIKHAISRAGPDIGGSIDKDVAYSHREDYKQLKTGLTEICEKLGYEIWGR